MVVRAISRRPVSLTPDSGGRDPGMGFDRGVIDQDFGAATLPAGGAHCGLGLFNRCLSGIARGAGAIERGARGLRVSLEMNFFWNSISRRWYSSRA